MEPKARQNGTDRDWRRKLHERLWEREPETRYERALLLIGRYLVVLTRDLATAQMSMRAMSMVYTTLLSLVPLLALAFSLFKAFGIHNTLEPTLLKFLEPIGPRADEVTAQIIDFVENIKVGVLGSLGVGLLFYTALSVVRKIESSFNYIWRIERVRPLSERFSEYLSVLLVGPVLMFSALGITASILNSSLVTRLTAMAPLGVAIHLVGKLIPYVLVISAFTFVYAFIPNTRVQMKAALAGGLFAGVLWESASLLFASFIGGSPQYDAIYSGFAIVILILLWFYIGWLILLIGCHLSFHIQHPEYLTPANTAPTLSGRSAEALGLGVVALVGQRFIEGKPPMTEDEITRALAAPPGHVPRVVDLLLHHRILARSAGADAALLPARDLETLTLGEVWMMLRREADPATRPERGELGHRISRILDEAESAFVERHGARSVRQWLTDVRAEQPTNGHGVARSARG